MLLRLTLRLHAIHRRHKAARGGSRFSGSRRGLPPAATAGSSPPRAVRGEEVKLSDGSAHRYRALGSLAPSSSVFCQQSVPGRAQEEPGGERQRGRERERERERQGVGALSHRDPLEEKLRKEHKRNR